MIAFYCPASLRRIRAAGNHRCHDRTRSPAANVTPHQDAIQETARYVAHAKHNYVPPGPAEDPWGPYIREGRQQVRRPRDLGPLAHAGGIWWQGVSEW